MRNAKFRLRRVPKLIIGQDTFDFVHFRGVAQGISDILLVSNHQLKVSERVSAGIAKWPEVLKDAYRCLKPGGYVELSELSSKFSSSLSHGNHLILFQCSPNATTAPWKRIMLLRVGAISCMMP
jgi:hypothetical protein